MAKRPVVMPAWGRSPPALVDPGSHGGRDGDARCPRATVLSDYRPSSSAGTHRSRTVIDNGVPGVRTGGHAADGTPDTRGVTEKLADAVTGDHIDDKTGKVVR